MHRNFQSNLLLNNGVEIPRLGLGTWPVRGKECSHSVTYALTHGYDMIDTAQDYSNERDVGLGWKASGRPRGHLFITTKIGNSNQGYELSQKTFKKSLLDLQTDFVDLLLIHWPDINHFDKTVETWQALIELQEQGLCRSIGVSNFTIELIEALTSQIDVIPAVNQVEFHTFLFQKKLLDYCNEKQIQIEAYSPLARGKFLDNEDIQQIADKHGKTTGQVMLSWGIHHDLVVIPKSTRESRIDENADIFFDLDEEDMKILDNIDLQTRVVRVPWEPPTW
jgi:diketogulonate reductase-like aldo/keto reductase